MDEAMALADAIASKPPATLAIGKEAFYRQIEMRLADAYDYAAGVMVAEHDACRVGGRHRRLPREADARLGQGLSARARPAQHRDMSHDSYTDEYIAGILGRARTIAMVGASGTSNRPSYFAMKYLLGKGYRVIPVNPGLAGQTILGQPVFAALAEVPPPVDIVDIFRSSAAALEVTREAIRLKDALGIKMVWMQLGVRNDEAAAEAEAAGLQVVMNRCPKIEYGRLSGEIGWAGVNAGGISSKRPLLRRAAACRTTSSPASGELLAHDAGLIGLLHLAEDLAGAQAVARHPAREVSRWPHTPPETLDRYRRTRTCRLRSDRSGCRRPSRYRARRLPARR